MQNETGRTTFPENYFDPVSNHVVEKLAEPADRPMERSIANPFLMGVPTLAESALRDTAPSDNKHQRREKIRALVQTDRVLLDPSV